MEIERDRATPLYEQVADLLRRQIQADGLKPGAPLPPESALIARFKTSRVTTRKALDLLVNEGLVVRRQGKGTFVASPKIQQDLHSLRGFAEVMAARGGEQAMEVVEFGVVGADSRVARWLRLAPGESVLRIKRRHFLQGAPVAYALISIPYGLGRAFTIDEVSTISIYALLEEKTRVEVKRAAQVIRAVAADQHTAELLALPRAAPVMMTERVTYSADEIPIEYILLFHRGDRYELAVELFRDRAMDVFRPTDCVAELL